MIKRIEYRQGDMLANPQAGVYLAHACNTKGAWGPYIAQQFKQRWPKAFNYYKEYCAQGRAKTGDVLIVAEHSSYPIICLFTSTGYGRYADSPEQILESTKSALSNLLFDEDVEIHSPKINSGKFRVPWEQTEALIEEYLEKNPHIKWVVWEL